MQTEGNLLYEQPKVSYTSFQPERTGQQLCEQELGEMMLGRGHLWLKALWKARHTYVRLLSSPFHEYTL